jgi:hypothetical protein
MSKRPLAVVPDSPGEASVENPQQGNHSPRRMPNASRYTEGIRSRRAEGKLAWQKDPDDAGGKGMAATEAKTLSAESARVLTDEVKSDAATLWAKLLRLYEGGAHKALGYPSWGNYYEAEFGQSGRQGYQILEAARVSAALSETHFTETPSQNAARELVPVLKEDPEHVGEVWAEVIEEHGPEPTAAQVREWVRARPSEDGSQKPEEEAGRLRFKPDASEEPFDPGPYQYDDLDADNGFSTTYDWDTAALAKADPEQIAAEQASVGKGRWRKRDGEAWTDPRLRKRPENYVKSSMTECLLNLRQNVVIFSDMVPFVQISDVEPALRAECIRDIDTALATARQYLRRQLTAVEDATLSATAADEKIKARKPAGRRVVIDDDAEGYVSPGPELGDEPPYRGHDDDVGDEYDYEAEGRFEADVAKLREEGWSVERIALELRASNDEVEAVLPEEDPNAEGVAYAYGTGTEEGTDEGEDK